ncbi:hypothetical protein [Prochlorococcus sp. MIT 1303]|uniref:hypothetical protein n=1 Tax=Prochlorococcus sp. MIT 1303 TaxID=1723647 RepID=UPI0007B37895|nr:hypothetical protein [Prochlorococcus sp. MIT 1303]KZR67006.1 hypothetical protein PMIT1303_00713 [Prochlorococcus sp. MIT 1303]
MHCSTDPQKRILLEVLQALYAREWSQWLAWPLFALGIWVMLAGGSSGWFLPVFLMWWVACDHTVPPWRKWRKKQLAKKERKRQQN